MYRRLLAGMLLASVASLANAPLVLGGDATPKVPAEPPANDVVVQRDAKILMRDGVNLAADVFLPARKNKPIDGRFPTILARTPYGKGGMESDARYFCARGYAVVLNDTRGRYGSEGTWRMIVDDVNDGHDVAAWIVKQPWSTGKIGTIGTSYVGGTQHALALSGAPGLTAMIPVDSLSNCGVAGMRHSGAFELRFMNWIFTIGAPNSRAALADKRLRDALIAHGGLMRQHIGHLPIRKGTTGLRVVPEYEDWLIEVMQHGDNDAFWKQPGYSVIDNVDRYADVPVYHVTGWYDSWCRQNVLNWQALSAAKRSPQRLIIGPWTHGQQGAHWAGETEFPREAALQWNDWRIRWFDRWLKGTQNGVEKEPPVKLFVMGGGPGTKGAQNRRQHGGVWRDEIEFPPKRTQFTPYYIHHDGTLSPERPTAPAAAGPDLDRRAGTTYHFDPLNPVPTIGGNLSSTSGLADAGGFDQRTRADTTAGNGVTLPLGQRNDVLVFQTPPLERDVEVTGPVVVKLWITSNRVDTDFTAKLIDVCPPTPDFPLGFDLNIGDSIVRCRYRDLLEKATLMVPGKIYAVTIHLYPTSNVFAKGHRIRLDISSSNFPRFDINPNTGEPLQQHRRAVVAENTVFHDAEHASNVLLPIIPR